MAKGQSLSEDYSSEKKVAAPNEEKQAIADRIAIIRDTFEKNKSLDTKDQKEISREDMVLAGLLPS